MKKILLLFILTACILSCDDDSFSTSPSSVLTFSSDTIHFDTLFSDVPSPTKTFWVYNDNKQALRCTSVRLDKGNQSGFRVNVRGVYLGPENGYSFNDVEIWKHDSIRVFIEATLPVNYKSQPTEVSDNLVFTLESGREQKVNLAAFSWDAQRLRDVIITDNTLWEASEKPRVIYGSLIVNEGATLTLKAGTVLYFHGDAGLDVKGRLLCEGTPDANVVLRGDRLDKMFDYLPYDQVSGQWKGVHFSETSYDNVLNYTDIHSSFNGIQIDSSDVSHNKLALQNSVVHNCQGYGVKSVHSNVSINNCQITNTLADCIFVDGGTMAINQSTIAQFYPFDANRGVALRASSIEHTLLSFSCNNSIVTGYAQDEMMLEFDNDAADNERNFSFDHCLLRTPRVTTNDSVKFQNVIYKSLEVDVNSGEKNFILVDADKQRYNFQLSEQSEAVGLANPATALPYDRLGNKRDEAPDAGCYEAIKKEDNETAEDNKRNSHK